MTVNSFLTIFLLQVVLGLESLAGAGRLLTGEPGGSCRCSYRRAHPAITKCERKACQIKVETTIDLNQANLGEFIVMTN
jgi:hypothetical protein